MIVFSQSGIADCPIHSLLRQGVDGAGLDTLTAFLAGFEQAQFIGGDQRMITQIQIRNQASHAATATRRGDELAVGSVTTQTDKVPQMFVGSQADHSILVEVVCRRGECSFSSDVIDHLLYGIAGTADHVICGSIITT